LKAPRVLPTSRPPAVATPPPLAWWGLTLSTALIAAFAALPTVNQAPPAPTSLDQALQQSFTVKYQMALALASQPAPAQPTTPYTVKLGDTLQSIAADYGVSPVAIVQATPGPVDFLQPGQTLSIPHRSTFVWPLTGPTLPVPLPRTSLDLVASLGTKVVAAQAGTVITAGRKYNGYGNMVEILHDKGMVTRYAHGAQVLVQAGTQVAQGQPILKVGCSGRCSRAHVRFEVRVKGQLIDPLSVLP